MHAVEFIQDLAIVMLTAGAATVLFHRFKQPVVLGYVAAGFIIGPHTFNLVHDEHTIRILAELGIVFLMFSLGLEFSLRKLAKVGMSAFVAAVAEILLMTWLGFQIGGFFGWNFMNSLFLGAILAISSTTIIVKALEELGLKNESFAHLIFGILIIEDILGIGMIALLSALALTGSLSAETVVVTMGQLMLFMTVALVLGILVVPRILEYVARFQSKEMLLVAVLGISFGFCLLVTKLEYSMALGAFLIGAIMAESKQMHLIADLTENIKDMFSAVFFVTVGMMLDHRVLAEYAVPVVIITAAVVVGKVISCSVGAFIGGNEGRTSLKVGMGLSQIGEFSFIIASIGSTLGVTSDFLYPIAVAVSSATTLLTPYLIRFSDPFSSAVASIVPAPVARVGQAYTDWLQSIRPQGERATVARIVRRVVVQVTINVALVIAIFLTTAVLGSAVRADLLGWIGDKGAVDTILWSWALLWSLPFLVASYRKVKALSLLLAELSMGQSGGAYTQGFRRLMSELIPLLFIVGLMLLVNTLSSAILPPTGTLAVVLVSAGVMLVPLWRNIERIHGRLQNTFLDTFDKKAQEKLEE